LQLVYFSVCLVLALIPAAIGMAVAEVDKKTVDTVVQVVILLAMVLGIIGPMLCLSVPSETQAVPFIVLSVMLALVVLAMNLLDEWILKQLIQQVDIVTFFTIVKYYLFLMFGMNVMSMAFFLLFCRQLGDYLNAEPEKKRATGLLQTGGFMLALMIGIIVYIASTGGGAGPVRGQPNDLAAVLSMILSGVMFAWLFWLISYGKLLIRLRTAIGNFRGATDTDYESGRLAD